ncbi:TetR/AcrR family transcriptional regulator [Leptospira levettii]|nr:MULTISPECIES: TetR/AcrR family transcriptional regulator [Leptospira]MCG6148759.1 TetR/AcrR family transcriptional regulator [Leptospira levettii]MCW7508798.1 TetR/AcrR family transcriptional regulator [Leptospira levettii]MCW7519887.1 TetR/AcrR family transcriptional regulator [Leptospira levettii]TGK97834.1 TetR/AcrR family transcriptional regulator [Leptospira levettii]TGL14452.1 TetR/AcrR family transcriptional regulator [Leptospira levettii]
MSSSMKVPVQNRSRERVEQILKTAKELIGEKGIDAVSMREIAQTAGIQIGSLYQYFPGKSTLLLSIMTEYYDFMFEETKRILDPVRTIEELEIASEKAFKQFVSVFQKDPALANLWAGARAIPELVIEDNRDTYRNADLMVRTMIRCLPNLKESELRPFALYFSHTLGMIVRFVREIDNEHGKAVLKETLDILKLKLREFDSLAKKKAKVKKRI